MRSGIFFSIIVLSSFCAPALAYDWSTNPGDGSEVNPYQISTPEQMNAIGLDTLLWDKHFKLISDLDMSELGSVPYNVIGNNNIHFTGIFDGNGHIVSGVKLDLPNSDYIGFFGHIEQGGVVKNLGLINVHITGGHATGGFVGYNAGTILSCFSTGSVFVIKENAGFFGIVQAGGFVGHNGGTILNCFSTGSVFVIKENTGSFEIVQTGGFAGHLSRTGSIENCYARVDIQSDFGCSGFVGYAYGVIRNCFSTGRPDSPHPVGFSGGYEPVAYNCFWDVQASGVYDSVVGRGLPTAHMKSAAFYGLNGWGGTTWTIDDGYDYPHLAWENTGHPLIPEVSSPLSGSGTEADPYRIYTESDFQAVGMSSDLFWDQHLVLMNDISLDGVELMPIGHKALGFTGTFEGNGYTISDMSLDLPDIDYVALFGHVGINGSVRNLGLENAAVYGRNCVGALAGYTNNATITKCYSTGSAAGEGSVGGLIGKGEYGTLEDCYSTMHVEGSGFYVGGLIGYSKGLNVTQCYATGDVSGLEEVGGLMGRNDSYRKTCLQSYATGAVTGKAKVGGLIGHSDDGRISHCYSVGLVTGDEYAGGLIGFSSIHKRFENIINCYWDIETSGIGYSNGGQGFSTDFLQRMLFYSLCGWSGTDWTIDEGADYPHLAWENTGDPFISESSVPLVGSGTDSDPYQIATAEDLSLLGYANTIWDKSFILINDLDFSENVMYSRIGHQPPGFTGDFEGDGHTIRNLTSQSQVSDYYLGLFSFTNNATISNLTLEDVSLIYKGGEAGGLVGWQEYGTITNCHVTGSLEGARSLGGLVGHLERGDIKDCTVDCEIVSQASSVGGLVGKQYMGTINNCHSFGSVTGGANVGGLIGEQYGSTIECSSHCDVDSISSYVGGLVGYQNGAIESCYSAGNVQGLSNVGGLTGMSRGIIAGCYSTSSVVGNESVGGLCGYNSFGARITNCYATGNVNKGNSGGLCGQNSQYGKILNSFWDIETSGSDYSAGGTGLSTLLMKNIYTYLNAEWDFLGEDINGVEDIWFLRNGIEYPRLVALNQVPIAKTDSDQTVFAWVDGFAEVRLDGTGSYDDDGDALEYFWYNDANELIASGAEPNVLFGFGVHEVTLIVNDGIEDSEPDSCVVTVIEALEGRGVVLPRALNRARQGRFVIGWLQLPEGVDVSELDKDEPLLMLAGDVEIAAEKQHVIGSHKRYGGRVNILAFFDTQAVLEAIDQNGNVELTLATKLASGQAVYGGAEVRVISHEPKPKKEKSSHGKGQLVRAEKKQRLHGQAELDRSTRRGR